MTIEHWQQPWLAPKAASEAEREKIDRVLDCLREDYARAVERLKRLEALALVFGPR